MHKKWIIGALLYLTVTQTQAQSEQPEQAQANGDQQRSLLCPSCPDIRGPKLQMQALADTLAQVGGDELLAAAITHVLDAGRDGVPNAGAFAFSQEKAQSGMSSTTANANWSGYADYAVARHNANASFINQQHMAIELRVWQADSQRQIPLKGYTLTLNFSENAAQRYALQSVVVRNQMPLPPAGAFPALDGNPALRAIVMSQHGRQ